MARVVYSTELLALSGLAGESDPVFAPHGQIMIVRDVDAYSAITGIGTKAECFFQDANTGGAIALFAYTLDDTDKLSFTWRGRQVFDSRNGGAFMFNASESDWDIRVSGYLLDI